MWLRLRIHVEAAIHFRQITLVTSQRISKQYLLHHIVQPYSISVEQVEQRYQCQHTLVQLPVDHPTQRSLVDTLVLQVEL